MKTFSIRRLIPFLGVALLLAPHSILDAQVRGASLQPATVASWSQAERGPGLERTIDVTLGGLPLAEALETVARTAEVSLTYARDLLPHGHVVSYRGRDVPTAQVFASVLDGTGLTVVEITANHLVVVAGPETEAVGVVTGTVTARDTGRPLAGVAVRISGTDLEAVTGSDGRYRLANVPAGQHTLIATSIGYGRSVLPVRVEDGRTAVLDFRLETEAVSLDELVVTGSLTPTPLKAIPSTMTVVKAAEIRQQNIETLDELFRLMVPGGVAPDNNPGLGGEAIYSVRGTSSLLGSSTLKLYVDGVEANQSYLNNLNPDIIERVEIISGPQASTLYGSGAISGVIQVFTRKGVPGTGPTLSGNVGVGLIDDRYVEDTPLTQDYGLDVSGGGPAFSYRVNGTWQEEGSWRPGSEAEAGTVSGLASIEDGSFSADLTALYRLDRGTDGVDPAQVEIGLDSADPPPTDMNDARFTSLSMKMEYDVLPSWSHVLALGYHGNTVDFFTDEPRRASPGDTLNSADVFYSGRSSIRYHTALELPLSDRVEATLTAGGEYTSRNFGQLAGQGVESVGNLTPTRASRTLLNTGSVFAQSQFGIDETFYLTAGITANTSTTTAETTWSPRVGATWNRSAGDADVKLRVGWGSALLAPNAFFVNGFTSRFQRVLPNPGLIPEEQTGWDAGVEVFFGERLTVGLSYFDQEAENLIDFVALNTQDPEGRFEAQYQNVGTIRNEGIEASVSVVPLPSLRLRGVAGWTESTVESLADSYGGDLTVGEEMIGVPAWTAGASASWMPVEGTTLNASLSHRGAWTDLSWVAFYGAIFSGTFTGVGSDYWIEYPSWTKFDVGVTQELGERITGFLQAKNVGNSYAFEAQDFWTPRGREVTVGARFRTR